jgi:hypothetical protein
VSDAGKPGSLKTATETQSWAESIARQHRMDVARIAKERSLRIRTPGETD